MTAGNIVGCTAKGSSGISAEGGGVYVAKNGTFTMTGGSIADCTAVNGSALYLKKKHDECQWRHGGRHRRA